MNELVYCFEKLEKTVMVDDNFIYPIYGETVNEFNEILIVRDTDNRMGKIIIKLEQP